MNEYILNWSRSVPSESFVVVWAYPGKGNLGCLQKHFLWSIIGHPAYITTDKRMENSSAVVSALEFRSECQSGHRVPAAVLFP